MSYDIYFVRRDPGQSFADALDVTEDSYDGDPGPLGDAEVEQWERILPRAKELLDDVEEFASDSSRELTDRATGIQLSMISDEMAITVPRERPEHDSVALMAKVYALARIVEDETSLEGYDPQLEEPITDPRQRLAAVAPSRPDSDDDWESASPGTTRSEPRGVEAPLAGPATPRRWWEFWRR